MASLDRAVVIYNPPSTGDGSRLAEELHADLALRLPDIPVRLYPTERAGHARDIAREATQTGHPLIVSVSADGGYNEVVDGSCGRQRPHSLRGEGSGQRQRPPQNHQGRNGHKPRAGHLPLAEATTAPGTRMIKRVRITPAE